VQRIPTANIAAGQAFLGNLLLEGEQ